MKRRVKFYLGNILIVSSILILFFTYLPFFKLFFPTNPKLVSREYSILIPKISASAPIITNVDPWKEVEYREALKRGVAQVQDSFSPGEEGTMYLFAHSSGSPWDITRYNTAFLRLGELQKGDKIIIYKDNLEFDYIVREKKEVWPSEISYLKDLSQKQLILQTCTPIGTSLKRLLVFADPV